MIQKKFLTLGFCCAIFVILSESSYAVGKDEKYHPRVEYILHTWTWKIPTPEIKEKTFELFLECLSYIPEDEHVEFIKKHNFIFPAAVYGYKQVLEWCKNKGMEINIKGKNGEPGTLLHAALYPVGDKETVVYLLEQGLFEDINSHDDHHQRTPLHCAVKHSDLSIVKLLIEKYGADPKEENEDGENALDYAEIYEQSEIAAYLKKVIQDQAFE